MRAASDSRVLQFITDATDNNNICRVAVTTCLSNGRRHVIIDTWTGGSMKLEIKSAMIRMPK